MAIDPAVSAIAKEQARQAELIAEMKLDIKALQTEAAKGYKPKPSVRFWENLTEEEIRAEVGALHGWYQQVAMAVLGAPELRDCAWTEHPAIWTVLDTVSELWKTLWIPERRTPPMVAAQAEYLLRIWPGLLETVVRETKACSHRTGRAPLSAVQR
jgi:hypothetical protein